MPGLVPVTFRDDTPVAQRRHVRTTHQERVRRPHARLQQAGDVGLDFPRDHLLQCREDARPLQRRLVDPPGMGRGRAVTVKANIGMRGDFRGQLPVEIFERIPARGRGGFKLRQKVVQPLSLPRLVDKPQTRQRQRLRTQDAGVRDCRLIPCCRRGPARPPAPGRSKSSVTLRL